MAVQFNTWAPGQVITAEKLNKMEEHIGESNALVQTEMDNMTSMQEALGFVPEYALVTTTGGTIDAEGNYTPNNLVNPTFTNFFKVPKSGKILIRWEQNVNNKQVGGTNRFAAYIWDSTQSTYLGFMEKQIASGENGSLIFPEGIGNSITIEPGMWVRFSYPSTTEKYVVGISFSDVYQPAYGTIDEGIIAAQEEINILKNAYQASEYSDGTIILVEGSDGNFSDSTFSAIKTGNVIKFNGTYTASARRRFKMSGDFANTSQAVPTAWWPNKIFSLTDNKVYAINATEIGGNIIVPNGNTDYIMNLQAFNTEGTLVMNANRDVNGWHFAAVNYAAIDIGAVVVTINQGYEFVNFEMSCQIIELLTNGTAYVNPSSGNDAWSGSKLNPLKTISRALTLGYRDICATPGRYNESINLTGGDFKLTSWVENQAYDGTTTPYRPKIKLIKGQKLTITQSSITDSTVTGIYQANFTAGQDTNIYKVFVSKELQPTTAGSLAIEYNTLLIGDMPDTDTSTKAFFPYKQQFYTPVLTETELSNEGTFWYDDSNHLIKFHAWKNTADGEYYIPDDDVENGILLQNMQQILLEDVKVLGCYNNCIYINKSNAVTLNACEVGYSAKGMGIKLDYTNAHVYDCHAYAASADGFNLHGYGYSEIINCTAFYCGDDGISHHEGCSGFIDGGEWAYNHSGGITPSYGSQIDVSNVYAHDNDIGINWLGSSAQSRRVKMSNCLIIGNITDVFVKWYVVDSWNNIFHTKNSQYNSDRSRLIEHEETEVNLSSVSGSMSYGDTTIQKNQNIYKINGSIISTNVRVPLTGTDLSWSSSTISKEDNPNWYLSSIPDFIIGHSYQFTIQLTSGYFTLTNPADQCYVLVNSDTTSLISAYNGAIWTCTDNPTMVAFVFRLGTYNNAIFNISIKDITKNLSLKETDSAVKMLTNVELNAETSLFCSNYSQPASYVTVVGNTINFNGIKINTEQGNRRIFFTDDGPVECHYNQTDNFPAAEAYTRKLTSGHVYKLTVFRRGTASGTESASELDNFQIGTYSNLTNLAQFRMSDTNNSVNTTTFVAPDEPLVINMYIRNATFNNLQFTYWLEDITEEQHIKKVLGLAELNPETTLFCLNYSQPKDYVTGVGNTLYLNGAKTTETQGYRRIFLTDAGLAECQYQDTSNFPAEGDFTKKLAVWHKYKLTVIRKGSSVVINNGVTTTTIRDSFQIGTYNAWQSLAVFDFTEESEAIQTATFIAPNAPIVINLLIRNNTFNDLQFSYWLEDLQKVELNSETSTFCYNYSETGNYVSVSGNTIRLNGTPASKNRRIFLTDNGVAECLYTDTSSYPSSTEFTKKLISGHTYKLTVLREGTPPDDTYSNNFHIGTYDNWDKPIKMYWYSYSDNIQIATFAATDDPIIINLFIRSASFNDLRYTYWLEDVSNIKTSSLKKNPYQNIPWDRIQDITSVTHAHILWEPNKGYYPQPQFEALQAKYDHLAISSYHPSAPMYPLEQHFTNIDSNILSSPNAEFAGFTGESGNLHLNAVGSLYSSRTTGSDGGIGTLAEFIQEAEECMIGNGGIITINHPAWTVYKMNNNGTENNTTAADMVNKIITIMDLSDRVAALEVWNASCEENHQVGLSTEIWDGVLSLGRQIYATAVPDHYVQYPAQDETAYGCGFNHMLVFNKTSEEVLAAYRTGRFYTTQYDDDLKLTYIHQNKTSGSESYNDIEIQVAAEATFLFKTATRSVEITTPATSATFTPQDGDIYVRVEAHRGNNTLWTNAIML